MSLKHFLICTGAAAALSIQSCGGSAHDPGTPDGAIMSGVEAMKNNDASAWLDSALTQEQQDKLAAEWDKKRKDEPPNEMENKQFAEQMAKLKSGALIDEMMPMVEAQLGQINKEQIAGMVGMMSAGMLQSPGMTEEQNIQAQALVSSLNQWIMETDVTNPEHVREVLVIAQNTAKKLDIKDLNAAAAMSFDQLVDKGDLVLAGVKDALRIYGINLDETLDSMSVDNVVVNGDTADVTISYTLFGSKQTMKTTMVKQGKRWYDSNSSTKIEETLR